MKLYSIEDIKPKNQSVIDTRPLMSDGGAGVQGEIALRSTYLLGAGQYMGLPFLLTYPTIGTVEL